MKTIRQGFIALIVASCMTVYGCGPNDNKGGMDQENSAGEGAIDSTRLSNFDSASQSTGDTATIK